MLLCQQQYAHFVHNSWWLELLLVFFASYMCTLQKILFSCNSNSFFFIHNSSHRLSVVPVNIFPASVHAAGQSQIRSYAHCRKEIKDFRSCTSMFLVFFPILYVQPRKNTLVCFRAWYLSLIVSCSCQCLPCFYTCCWISLSPTSSAKSHRPLPVCVQSFVSTILLACSYYSYFPIS
jgi:hypothetical protein